MFCCFEVTLQIADRNSAEPYSVVHCCSRTKNFLSSTVFGAWPVLGYWVQALHAGWRDNVTITRIKSSVNACLFPCAMKECIYVLQGRCRALESKYYMLVGENSKETFQKELEMFKGFEKVGGQLWKILKYDCGKFWERVKVSAPGPELAGLGWHGRGMRV